jgi:hypothetical protein
LPAAATAGTALDAAAIATRMVESFAADVLMAVLLQKATVARFEQIALSVWQTL